MMRFERYSSSSGSSRRRLARRRIRDAQPRAVTPGGDGFRATRSIEVSLMNRTPFSSTIGTPPDSQSEITADGYGAGPWPPHSRSRGISHGSTSEDRLESFTVRARRHPYYGAISRKRERRAAVGPTGRPPKPADDTGLHIHSKTFHSEASGAPARYVLPRRCGRLNCITGIGGGKRADRDWFGSRYNRWI